LRGEKKVEIKIAKTKKVLTFAARKRGSENFKKG